MFKVFFRGLLRKGVFRKFRNEIVLYQSILKDPRTPVLPKLILTAAVGYLLLPFDFIPDFIPILGQLDDLILIPVMISFALKLLPKELVEEHRRNLKA